MTSPRHKTAALILEGIAEEDRAGFIVRFATALDSTAAIADIALVAALLEIQPASIAREFFLKHLCTCIEDGNIAGVVEICKEQREIRAELIGTSIQLISSSVAFLMKSTGDNVTVPGSAFGHVKPVQAGTANFENPQPDISILVRHLQFISSIDLAQDISIIFETLFPSCLALAGASYKNVCNAATRAIHSLLNVKTFPAANASSLIWLRIQELLSSSDVYYQTLASSLWLRWIMNVPRIESSLLSQRAYWDTIAQQLRHGDTERRKGGLHILRISINAVTSETEPLATPVTLSSTNASPAALQQQYDRFCTVFETIILGRYLNQVQECENDLDFLSSSQSAVHPMWLYTLLTAALDHKMQESNQKFIGSWIMRSRLRLDAHLEFADFFRDALLPWLIQGYLFTSSLRSIHGSLRCLHGDRLATYLCDILSQGHASLNKNIVSIISNTTYKRQRNNFPYAVVYLLEGIGQAAQAASPLQLEAGCLAQLAEMATWTGPPEVARDYMLARTWRLCHLWTSQSPASIAPDIITQSASHWNKLVERSSSSETASLPHFTGSIASGYLPPSQRETNESTALDKCRKIVEGLQNPPDASHDAAKYVIELTDVWNDLEYLEYPKTLLAALPEVILNTKLVRLALDQAPTDKTLVDFVNAKLRSLTELTQSRAHLLFQLMNALRSDILHLTEPSTGTITVDIQDCMIAIARNPPTARVDVQLEDATTSLMQGIDVDLQCFNYEFYFGCRESVGYAGYLDFIARLRAFEPNKRIFEHILQRWLEQKVPPPSVSPWKSGLQLQTLLLSAEHYLPHLDPSSILEILTKLQHILSIEPLPTFRYLLEWIISRIFLQQHSFRSIIIDKLRTINHHSNPKFLASLMKIGVRIAMLETSTEDFALQLATTFVPLSASSKVIIRHEAQWQIPILFDHAVARAWTNISDNPVFRALTDFIRSLERFDEPPHDRLIDTFHPIHDHNLTNLVEGPWYDLDRIELPRTSRDDFLKLYSLDKTNSTLPPLSIPLGEPVTTPPRKTHPPSSSTPAPATPLPILPAPSTLQTKGTAYLTPQSPRRQHPTLHVCASLIDNPTNLGGLSRVSEIFGAGALHIRALSVLSSKDFISVSVSSHLHLPISALAPTEIPEFLTQQKREGYTVVGIEQTDRSVVLGKPGSVVLPEKCVLVLGSEREGIPAEVLIECDLLVEIPQRGVTRSLNVQTAAGIVLSEYARQFS